MNKRTRPDTGAGLSVGQLFVGTAVVAIIFSVGLIVGQHLLLNDRPGPLVTTDDVDSTAEPTPEASDGELSDPSSPELFSFYDLLTNPEVPQRDFLDPLPDAASSQAEEILASGGNTNAISANDFDFDAADPQTDDGTLPARYTLQVASHATMERARTDMDRLRHLELEPHVVAVELTGHGKHYRVRVGKFATEDQALAFQQQLSTEYDLQAFITPL